MRRLTFLLFAATLAHPAAFAQEQFVENRLRTRPFLMPKSEAPIGSVRSLSFVRDASGNQWLYSAGDDKIVRGWRIVEGEKIALSERKRVPWPIFLDVRGIVYALDAVQDGAKGVRLAFGGMGVKAAQVNVVHVTQTDQAEGLTHDDMLSNEVVRSIDMYRYGNGECRILVGHEETGKACLWRLADSITTDSQRIWTYESGNLGEVWQVSYSPDGQRFAMFGPHATKRGALVEFWKVNNEFIEAKSVRSVTMNQCLAWLDNSNWIAGEVGGLTHGQLGSESQQVLSQANVYACAAAAAPAANDAVAAIGYAIVRQGEVGHHVGMWTVDGGLAPLAGVKFKYVSAVQVSQDKRWIAAAGAALRGPEKQATFCIALWDAKTKELKAIVPDDETLPKVGGPIANIAVLPAKRSIFQDSIGFAWGYWEYNTPRPAIRNRFNQGTLEILETDDISTPEPSTKFLENQKTGQWRLGQNPYEGATAKEGVNCWDIKLIEGARPRSHIEFVHQETGRKLLVIGYDAGILVWDAERFRELRGAPQGILRSFSGHAGQTTALAASPKGDYLVSGGYDGTIRVWSLEGLPGRGEPSNELGVRFRWDDARKQLVVHDEPEHTMPAYEMGLRKGQVVDRLTFGRLSEVPRWLQVLKHLGGRLYTLQNMVKRSALGLSGSGDAGCFPGEELNIYVKSKSGKATQLSTRLYRDPIYTLRPTFDGNWYLSTPQGFYEASDEADQMSGIANLNPTAAPTVGQHRHNALASQLDEFVFAARYRKPGVIKDLVRTRQPPEPPDHPLPPNFKFDLAADKRSVTVQALENGDAVASLALRINAKEIGRVQGNAIRQTIDPQFLRQGRNDFVAIATIVSADGRRHDYVGTFPLRSSAADSRPDRFVHFLGIGVENVEGFPALKLNYCEEDVEESATTIQQSLKPTPDGVLRQGLFQTVVNEQANKSAVVAAFKKLAAVARPEDFAIVMLTGHGVAGAGLNNAQAGKQGVAFSFLTADTDPKNLATGLTGVELQNLLAQCSCKSLLILDTCHAGGAGVDQQLESFPDRGAGPMLLTSCRADEESLEHAGIKHGVFTMALLEALDGRNRLTTNDRIARQKLDRDDDGWLSVGDLCRYVVQRTPEARIKIGDNDPQNPQMIPSVTFRDFDDFQLWPAP